MGFIRRIMGGESTAKSEKPEAFKNEQLAKSELNNEPLTKNQQTQKIDSVSLWIKANSKYENKQVGQISKNEKVELIDNNKDNKVDTIIYTQRSDKRSNPEELIPEYDSVTQIDSGADGTINIVIENSGNERKSTFYNDEGKPTRIETTIGTKNGYIKRIDIDADGLPDRIE